MWVNLLEWGVHGPLMSCGPGQVTWALGDLSCSSVNGVHHQSPLPGLWEA